MKSRIYYGDGTVVTVERPEEAPTRDVQAIAYDDPNRSVESAGRIVLFEFDIYIYSDRVQGWHGTNKYFDLLEHLSRGCGPGGVRAVLTGSWIDDAAYRAIKARAMSDEGLAPKTANKPIRECGDL